jgi:hypothetical protein
MRNKPSADQPIGGGNHVGTDTFEAAVRPERELLPCPVPFPDLLAVDPRKVSRPVARRLQRSVHWKSWCNDGMMALNGLYGKDADGESTRVAPLSEGQRACHERLVSIYSSLGEPSCELNPAGAFAELCGNRPGYSHDVAEMPGLRSPFVEGCVSLPSAGSSPADPSSLLQGSDVILWKEWQTRILLPHAEAVSRRAELKVRKPYSDPLLIRNQAAYGRFLRQLLDGGVCELGPDCKHTVGIFFVSKRSGKLRMILDTRLANTEFRSPPHTNLPSAASWARMEFPAAGDVYLAQSDISDAFYRVLLPPGLSEHFVLPRIATRYIPGLTPEQIAQLGPYCSPRLRVLPMGWTWALHFCQVISESCALRAGLEAERTVCDRGPATIVEENGRVFHAEYVDNFLALGTDAQAVLSAVEGTREQLQSRGLTCHPTEGPDVEATFTGVHIDGRRGTIRVGTQRMWRLRMALDYALGQTHLSGNDVGHLVGHFTWSALLRRAGLAVAQSCYSFARHVADRRGLVWPSVKRELKWMRDVLPLLFHNARASWSPTVHVSDASEQGFGVCTKQIPSSDVKAAGRSAEIWRYRAEDTVNARAHALRPDILCLDPQSFARVPDMGALHSDEGQALLDEIPASWLNDGWTVSFKGKWKQAKDIMRLEGSAVVMSARHILRTRRNFDQHHLLLCDNLALVLALGKGRGKSYELNATCRELSALSLFTGALFHVRWIPSELNPSDAPSRGRDHAGEGLVDRALQAAGFKGLGHGELSVAVDELAFDKFIQDEGRALGHDSDSEPDEQLHGDSLEDRRRGQKRVGRCAPQRRGCRDTRAEEEACRAHCPSVGESRSCESPWTISPGNERGAGGDPSRLHATALALERLVPPPGLGVYHSVPARRGHTELHGRDVSERPRGGRRSKDVGSAPALLAGVEEPHAAVLEGSGWLAEAGTCAHPRSLALDGPDGLGRSGALPRQAVGGLCDAAAVHLLLAPKRAAEPDAGVPHPARPFAPRSRVVVGAPATPFRVGNRGQERGLRREHRDRQARPALARHILGHAQTASTEASNLELLPGAVCRASVSSGAEHEVDRLAPGHVLIPARRGKRRRPRAKATPAGDKEAGQMAVGRLSPPLREGVSGLAPAPAHPGRREAPCEEHRPAPRGLLLGAAKAAKANLDAAGCRELRRLIKLARKRARARGFGRAPVALEIFSGTGRLTAALNRQGMAAIAIDIKDNPLLDMSQPVLLAYVLQLIAQGVIAFIWLGTPCASWSLARRGIAGSPGGPLRTCKYIYGHPEAMARSHDLAKIKAGNRTMRVSAALLRACVLHGVRCGLENPHSSRLFRAPPIQSVCRVPTARSHTVDFCQFSCPYRKRTRIVLWLLGSAEALDARCTGKQGLCSATGRHHVILSGNEGKQLRTALAEPYPFKFVNELAKHICSKIRV